MLWQLATVPAFRARCCPPGWPTRRPASRLTPPRPRAPPPPPRSFVTLDFIPPGTDLKPILPVLAKVFDQALAGGGAKGINFQDLAADLAQVGGALTWHDLRGWACAVFLDRAGRLDALWHCLHRPRLRRHPQSTLPACPCRRYPWNQYVCMQHMYTPMPHPRARQRTLLFHTAPPSLLRSTPLPPSRLPLTTPSASRPTLRSSSAPLACWRASPWWATPTLPSWTRPSRWAAWQRGAAFGRRGLRLGMRPWACAVPAPLQGFLCSSTADAHCWLECILEILIRRSSPACSISLA